MRRRRRKKYAPLLDDGLCSRDGQLLTPRVTQLFAQRNMEFLETHPGIFDYRYDKSYYWAQTTKRRTK